MSIETIDRPQPPDSAPEREVPRRVRRRIRPKVLVSLLCGGLLLAVSAYCGVVFGLLAVAGHASENGDQQRAISAAEWFGRLSPFERHKAHFNVGTAEAKQADFDAAQTELERALQLTPVRDECAVRQNLAFVFEQQAEESRQNDDLAAANTKFDAARTTLADAPEECRPPDSAQDRAMEQAEERVQESQEEMNAPPDTGSQSADGSSSEEPEGGDSETGGTSENDGAQGEDDDSGPGSGEDDDSGLGNEKDKDSGAIGDSEQPAADDEKREELRQRQQESQQRQEESNSRQRSGGISHDKPW